MTSTSMSPESFGPIAATISARTDSSADSRSVGGTRFVQSSASGNTPGMTRCHEVKYSRSNRTYASRS